jgi:hypothetical protein
MARLGSFGAAARELAGADRDTFEFFDREFTVVGVIPPMLMLRLGASMAGELGEIDSNAVMYKALRHALTVPGDPDNGVRPDESQFDEFEALAIKKACDADELIRLVFALVGIPIAFPTEPQPTSPDGLPETSPNSKSSASDTPASPTSE